MISEQSNCNIGAIFGLGRSGTTWLGAIVASHPDILYRFEPFHRLQKTQSTIKEMYELTRSDSFSAQDVSRMYNCLLPAYPESEKPPFFSKNFPSRLSFGKSFLWPLARKNQFLSPAFRSLYTPKGKPFLVFKEVDYSDMVVKFLAETDIPVVYIVRHPCAVTSSIIRGQKNSLMPMPKERLVVLKRVMPIHEPKLAEIYLHKLEELTIAEQEALYWLVQTGRALRACQKSANGLIVIYEELTERPLEIAQQVFQHFKLEMPAESVAFIEESSNKSLTSAIKRGEVNMNQYFTIFRDTKAARDRWKEEMSEEDQMRVMQIVKDSPEFALGAEKGFWA
ncbi:MAG: sulfotransferase domain-containing protein [Xenococcaceae cyanobacterium]